MRSALVAVLASRHQRETLVHAAADAHLAKLSVAVRYAFAQGRKAVKRAQLRDATTERQALSAVDAAPPAVKKTLLDVLPKALLACLRDGGEAGLLLLKRYLRSAEMRALAPALTMTFNATDANAVAWAKEHAVELAAGISETTRERIASAIAGALEDGDLGDAYDEILAAVGDDARAELIARTETMTAASEGQRQGWDQAVEAGLLPADAQRVWIATEDACPICDELDGEVADLDGEYPGDGGDGPPAHPNCRCTEGINTP